MLNPQVWLRVTKLFFAAFLVLILFFPTPGVSSPLSMEAFLGFDGIFSLHKWTPLNIILENRGATIRGALEVVVTSGSEFHGDVRETTYVMDVELPTRAKKMYPFTIYIDSVIHPLMIRLKQADRTIVTESFNLRRHVTEGKLNLFIGLENVPDFSSIAFNGRRPVMAREEFMPETWYGYDGVEVVVLDVTVIENMKDRQLTALAVWIKKGGRLITAGRLNYGSLLKQRTKPLLPIRVLGYKRLFKLNSFEKFCNQRLVSPEGFLILKVDLEGALPLVQEGDTPIILQKPLGLGRITFLTFDFDSSPFSEWAGRQAFWAKLLEVKPTPEDAGTELEEKKIMSAMISDLPARFPRLSVVLIFLAGYVLLLQAVFIRLKKKREQRRRHIVFLLLIIALFSVSSYGLFYNRNKKMDPMYNSFLQLKVRDQSMTGRIEYLGGIYGLKSGIYRLDFGPSFYPIIPIPLDQPGDTILHTMTFHENKEGQVISIPLEGWSYRFFKMSDTISFQFQGDVSEEDQGLLITVENRTPHPVFDSQIYYAGRFFFFGDIGSGKKRVMRLSRTEIDKSPLFQSETSDSVAARMIGDATSIPLGNLKQYFLENLLLQVHSRYQTKPGVFYLFGWIESNVVPNPFIHAGMNGEEVGLLEWETPVRARTR